MNSSESSVIVLDSDDEDQPNCQPSKTIQSKSNDPKTPVHSGHPSLQIVRNSITLTPTISNQHGKTKNATVSQSPLIKNTNSISIIPLNQMQNEKTGSNSTNHSTKNPQVSKISPKSSPRNSPKLKVATNTGVQGTSTSVAIHRKTPPNILLNSSAKEKQSIENIRKLSNSETPPANHNISAQSLLKRKYDNHADHIELNLSNKSNPKVPSKYKRIKPTMVSSAVNSKWKSLPNTITIEDDDEDLFLDNYEKSNQPRNLMKSRSNSITSSSASSPSPSTSSIATSPQSQCSPTTPSPSLKDLSRRSTTPKGFSESSIGNITPEILVKSTSSLVASHSNKDKDVISEKSIKSLGLSCNSPIPNGNLTVEDKSHGRQINEIIPAFEQLIEACRKSDNSNDMQLLIDKKLLRYYHSIHPDYITSKSFKKTVENITSEILETPNLVYIKLKTIIEELKSRKDSKVVVVSNDGQTSTGNDEIDERVRILNKGLRKLKHIIAKLEEDEVDWDSDCNSSYLKVERYKKRACEIYEKICDLTGESKHAQRTVRKPILFDHTAYPKINKAIETFVNKTKTFPDFHDIFAILQHCNKNYNLDLTSEELKRIAQDAFVKVGKLLQNRRKTDLYETLSHYTERDKDPALEDLDLTAKLNENKKHYGKINALIQKYAREQDTLQSEKLKTKEEARKANCNNNSPTDTSDNDKDKITTSNLPVHNKDNYILNESIKGGNDENTFKSPSTTAKTATGNIRNMPSCSQDSKNNNEKKTEIMKSISDKDSDKKETSNICESSKTGSNNKDTNNSSNSSSSSSNGNNSSCNSKNTKSINISNIKQSETITNNINRTSNANSNNDKAIIKIVNVASLCEKPKTNLSPSLAATSSSSAKTLDKNNDSKPMKSINSKSNVPSLLTVSNTSKNTKINCNKEIDVDEIILSDDDV